MKCRACDAVLHHKFLDLGFAPPSNAYLTEQDLNRPEKYYPLRLHVCDECWLVQTEDHAAADELFNPDYAYFSSTSSSWLAHARAFSERAREAFRLGPESYVVEVASNDGYLLKNFVEWGIPCLGIEPTGSTASVAEATGVPVLREFFGEGLARRLAGEGRHADLIVGNNVYAHVPDINDFTRGLATLLKPQGIITLEFPHLMQLVAHSQFDTVYHEHFSYLSLGTVARIFDAAGLKVWDVEELSTHGGSLRVYGSLRDSDHPTTARVAELLLRESEVGLTNLATYLVFQSRAEKIKDDLLMWLTEQKRSGVRVAAYGAAAKGNTLLNFAGVKPDLLPYVCDAALAKQGKYLPGSHVPVFSPRTLRDNLPDVVLILPWNIVAEVRHELQDLAAVGVRLATAIPELRVL